MSQPLPPLGDLEHELVTLLWTHGAMTAVDLRKKVPRKLKDPTIRTVLRRLEQKGYVVHTVDNGTFIYKAKETRENTAARQVKGIIDKFCDGSIEKALLSLVEAALIQPKQLELIAGKLKRGLKGR